MTSTSFNVGLTDNPRLSSRVLRPPGGGHTDIFGGDPEPPMGKRRANQILQAQAKEQMNNPEATEVTEATEQHDFGDSEVPQSEAAVAPAPAPVEDVPAPPENGNVEIIEKTEIQPQQIQQQPAAEPPKRVRVPPGGFSSGLW